MSELPIAEIFSSFQGEGAWQGTPMTFIRLAGCSVGRYTVPSQLYAVCRSFDGIEFPCDTNYRVTYRSTIDEIVAEVGLAAHVCITGGEPFVHNTTELFELLDQLWLVDPEREIHFETSGTIPIAPLVNELTPEQLSKVWIACSPKWGYFLENDPFISEWKFLVDEHTDPSKIVEFLDARQTSARVSIQPIDASDKLQNDKNLNTTRVLALKYGWSLSLQLHKIIGVR